MSNLDKEADLRTPCSSSFNGFPIAMTGMMRASFDREVFRSRSFVIERRTEPNPAKGLRDVLGEAAEELGVAFLLGPKGKRERKERNAGMPEPAGVVGGIVGDAPMP